MYTDYTEDNDEEKYYDEENNNKFDKEKLKRIAFIVLVGVIVLILVLLIAKGCSNKKTNTGTSTISNQVPTIVPARENISLNVGESFQLYVDVLNAKVDNPAVTWYSEDSSIASVNDDGYITAEAEGETNIVIVYRQDGKVYQKNCAVVVSSTEVKVESISLGQDEITVKVGGSLLLQVTVNPIDAKVSELIFESEAPEIATVDEKGYVKAVGVGTTAITVKTSDETVSDSVVINVTEKGETTINPTGLTLIGLLNGLSVGTTSEIKYDLTPSNATDKTITWTSSDPSVATVENGIVRGIKAGKCIISATTSNNISSQLEITVTSNDVLVESINIIGDTAISMSVGGTKRIQYTITPSNATNKKVKFTSSNSKVVLVDSNGIIAAVGVGNAVVTITTEDGSKNAIANITVYDKNVNNIITSTSTDTNISSSNTSSTSTYTSDNSSSSSSSDSSSYSSSSSDSQTSTSISSTEMSSGCSAYDMMKIQHNEQGVAVVSTMSFANTKPFVDTNKTPTLTVTEFSDCISSANYYVYYSTSTSGFFSSDDSIISGKIKKNGTIKLKNTNGYYKINIVGKTTDGNSLTKTYYAYVNKAKTTTNSSDYFTLSPQTLVKSGNKITITKNNSKVKYIYYCLKSSSDTNDCAPLKKSGLYNNIYYGSISFESRSDYSKTVYYRLNSAPSITYGNKICFKAYTNSFVGKTKCVTIAK